LNLILKDSDGSTRKKYKKFLERITPPEFENIYGISKFILLNQEIEVLMVTNYKDNLKYRNGKKKKDGTRIIEELIVPLLKSEDSFVKKEN